MSFLYVILAILLLVAAIVITSIRLRLGNERYLKTHPPKKHQEEFLKACELYLEYRKDPAGHPKPARDAKRDAGLHISAQGYLPACMDSTALPRGMDIKLRLSVDDDPAYMSFHAIKTASQQSFHECQVQDSLLSGYSQDKRFWKESTFDINSWTLYCSEMNEAFNSLVDRYLSEAQENEIPEIGPKIAPKEST